MLLYVISDAIKVETSAPEVISPIIYFIFKKDFTSAF
jgi:hypothetical protein